MPGVLGCLGNLGGLGGLGDLGDLGCLGDLGDLGCLVPGHAFPSPTPNPKYALALTPYVPAS